MWEGRTLPACLPGDAGRTWRFVWGVRLVIIRSFFPCLFLSSLALQHPSIHPHDPSMVHGVSTSGEMHQKNFDQLSRAGEHRESESMIGLCGSGSGSGSGSIYLPMQASVGSIYLSLSLSDRHVTRLGLHACHAQRTNFFFSWPTGQRTNVGHDPYLTYKTHKRIWSRNQ